MASNVLKALTEDFLHCSICINRFKDPKVLPCIHSFCLDCLEEYVQKLKSNKLPCPTCRKVCDLTETGVKGLQTNFHLVNLGERMDLLERLDSSKSNSYTCDSCEATDVAVYCLECDLKLCTICQSQHKKFPTLRSHSLVPIKEIKKPKYQQALQNAKAPHCDLHPTESLRFYCKTCSKLICRDCTIVQHPKPDHECVEASCQLQHAKQGLLTLLNESSRHLEQNLTFIKTGQAGLDEVSRKSTTVRQEIKTAYEEMTTAIEKQLKIQMENMCTNITEAEAQRITKISEKVKRASTWVTRLKNIQKLTQILIDENNIWEILGMSSNIMSAFHVLKCDSDEFSWHQSELNQRERFYPQTVPSVDLGRCRGEFDVVLSDSEGNFILCSYDRRTSTVCLYKLRKDNDYNWDKADYIAPNKWDIGSLSYANLTATIARDNQFVFVGMGSSIGVFDLSYKSFERVTISKGVKSFTHISWLGVGESGNNYIYVKQSHESRVRMFCYNISYDGYEERVMGDYRGADISPPVKVTSPRVSLSDASDTGWTITDKHISVGIPPPVIQTPSPLSNASRTGWVGAGQQTSVGIPPLVKQTRFPLSNASKTGWTIPGDHPSVNSIIVYNTFIIFTLDKKGYSEEKSVHLLKENECSLIQPPPPVSLVSAKKLSILKASLELQIATLCLDQIASSQQGIPAYNESYGIQQKNQNDAIFSCYFLWCGKKTLPWSSLTRSDKLAFVITQYDSRQKSNIRSWDVSEESSLPVACFRDVGTGELRVCDKYGAVTTCFMHEVKTSKGVVVPRPFYKV